jgi:hypothetical protein
LRTGAAAHRGNERIDLGDVLIDNHGDLGANRSGERENQEKR